MSSIFGDCVKSSAWVQNNPNEIIMGKRDQILIKDYIGNWMPYARFGDHYTCLGTFVRPTDREKWLNGEEVELLT